MVMYVNDGDIEERIREHLDSSRHLEGIVHSLKCKGICLQCDSLGSTIYKYLGDLERAKPES